MARPCGGTGARQHVCGADGRPAPEGTSSAAQERASSTQTHADTDRWEQWRPHPDPALDTSLLGLAQSQGTERSVRESEGHSHCPRWSG